MERAKNQYVEVEVDRSRLQTIWLSLEPKCARVEITARKMIDFDAPTKLKEVAGSVWMRTAQILPTLTQQWPALVDW